MKCWKCDKEMDREEGKRTIKGVTVDVSPEEGATEEEITYNNLQLGKYSDGKGGTHVGICYECYIDSLFQIEK